MGGGLVVHGTVIEQHQISDLEFQKFQQLLHNLVGIHLPETKKCLLCGRLSKRLREREMGSFGEYYDLLTGGHDPGELQVALNLLTTNETYFFRESQHFELLRQRILKNVNPARVFRVWSAACSTGEEPYTIAMTLAEELGMSGWEVLGSDISTRVLEQAQMAHYPIERTKDIPRQCLTRYCLRGVGEQDGTFIIDRELRSKVHFRQINLNNTLPNVGEFDVIFLRNVMIYFDMEKKRQVVSRLMTKLRPGGRLIVGHSESLNGITDALVQEAPTVYAKP
jgi:chemotaxis protein methyltransferase CheR